MRDKGGGWSGEERHVFVADEVFCFCVQVGDGSTTQRNSPVSVSGLGSGVAMIALGVVRFVAIASGCRGDMLCWSEACAFDRLRSCYGVVRGCVIWDVEM